MLYQTHYPSFLFQFHPPPFFTCSTSTPSSSSSSSPLSLSLPPSATITPTSTTTHLSSLPRVEGSEMECVALKTSFRKEMAVKEVFDDLLWGLNGQSGAVQNCEDFSVDDLLDFSNDDGFVADDEAHEDENKPNTEQPSSLKAAVITPEEEEKDISTPSSCLSEKNELVEPNSELSVPADDLENLEWLSHFVEDSFSGYNASLPAGFLAVKPKNPAENRPLPDALKPCFKSPVPGKARSKRTRTGGRVWSTLGSPSLSESSSTSSSSSSSMTSSSCPLLMYATAERPSQQKKLKRSSAGGGASRMMEGPTGGSTRRCSHCGVQKTPQWRTGPNGAKTLCNACGVRYKSGRLVPEYRPAGSPTFSSELHSNHHRKVMEIRRKKEVVVVPSQVVVMPEPGLMTTAATTPVVRNF